MTSLEMSRLERDGTGDTQTRGGVALRNIAVDALYLSLALIFIWIGGMKFTAYEAQGIAPFVMNSPLTSWMHAVFGVQGAAYVFGVYEIATGLLILGRWLSPILSALGGLMAVITFLVTLSFMFTTPGVSAPEAGGFPALSAEIGQFLAKDAGLLAISLYILGDSLVERGRSRMDTTMR